MDKKGYIFTLVTVLISLLLLSLVSFYIESSEPEMESLTNKMSTDELHYFIEDLKKDLGRAVETSGRKSAVYVIGAIMNSSVNLADYEMENCTSFKYPINCSQAAIAELMLCGTLGKSLPEMQNNTLPNWTERMESQYGRYNVNVRVKNLSMAMYDPWNFAVVAVVEISADNGISYYSNNDSIASLVSIIGLEDPLHYIKGDPDILPEFQSCQNSGSVTGEIINGWLDSGCYHESNLSYNGSSFFDRLDGNLNLSEFYVNQSRILFNETEIGLEGFSNVYELYRHGVLSGADNVNLTWIDHRQWQSINGTCCVNGTREYPFIGGGDGYPDRIIFLLEEKYVSKYNILEATCGETLDCDLIPYP